ncbi:C-type lectin domain family 4 member E-like [Erpetoichthys calabaricus]|uniref:C-type lectin domain family 4 member E-like n=1 Tax=Erpetoichthys calabaricus TaxID=27687 RepID=UPI00109F4965|nr:C-type lectin domain family 4 member E-like [Erpetoichthys calabaricus]
MDEIYMNDDIFHSTLSSSKKQESKLKSCRSSQKEVENIYMNFGDSSVCPPATANQTKITPNKVSSSSLEERKQRQWDNREADFCGLFARSCCWLVSSLTLLLVLLLFAFGIFFIHAEKKLHDMKKKYASLSENRSLANEELNQMRSNFSHLSTKHLTLQFNYSTLFDKTCPLCPYGWLIHQTSCYYISTDQMNWNDSQGDCMAKGGHLVIITNEKEQTFLNEHVNKSHAWIGLSDLEEERKWIWVDSTTPTMRYWAEGQPDDWNGEDCAHIRQWPGSINSWNDLSCEFRIGRVCEKKQNI